MTGRKTTSRWSHFPQKLIITRGKIRETLRPKDLVAANRSKPRQSPRSCERERMRLMTEAFSHNDSDQNTICIPLSTPYCLLSHPLDLHDIGSPEPVVCISSPITQMDPIARLCRLPEQCKNRKRKDQSNGE